MKALLKMMKQHQSVALALLSCLTVVAAYAQSGREQVPGVKNFGRVTDQYFRGGAVTPEGITNLHKMGVRTLIDLRDEPSPDEAPTAKRLGMRYYNFPMTGHDTPTDAETNHILSLIQNAKEPVYVHCSAGKHRAGTLAALYRIRVQGWSLDKAWAEQQSYGFGAIGGHPELYAYVYERGGAAVAKQQESIKPVKASKSKEQDSDEVKQDSSDETRSAEKSKKESKIAKAKKKDDDDDDDKDDDDDDDKDKADKERKKELKRQKKDKSEKAKETAVIAQNEPVAAPQPAANIVSTGLFADSRYLSYSEAIQRARSAGATGEILKIDLEWDAVRNFPTWDVTFASGNEFEVNALNGEVLGSKAKAPAKLATLKPLNLQAAKYLSFTALIRQVAAAQQHAVLEIELKQFKGQNNSIYEVALANGVTLFYDAATGETVNGI